MSHDSTTRDHIMTVCQELFCRFGYHALSTQTICTEAHVLKGTLYHFFPGKLALAESALEQFGQSARNCFERIATEKSSPPRRVKALFDIEHKEAERQQQAYGNVTGCLVANFSHELSATHPTIRERIQAIYASWANAIQPIFRDLGQSLKASLETANVTISLMRSAIMMAKVHNQPSKILGYIPWCRRLLIPS